MTVAAMSAIGIATPIAALAPVDNPGSGTGVCVLVAYGPLVEDVLVADVVVVDSLPPARSLGLCLISIIGAYIV